MHPKMAVTFDQFVMLHYQYNCLDTLNQILADIVWLVILKG